MTTALPEKTPRWPFLLIITFLLAAQIALIVSGITPVATGRLVDTDSYMWLMRVEGLLDGTGWFNHDVPRMNTPFGDVLNWSRPTGAALDAVVERLKALKLTFRNVALDAAEAQGACIFTGEPAVERIMVARAY